MSTVEHRFGYRIRTNFIAYIILDGRLIETRALNVGKNGMMLETSKLSCPINTRISVCCILTRRYYEIDAHTIYNADGKIGIEFNKPQTQFFHTVMNSAEIDYCDKMSA